MSDVNPRPATTPRALITDVIKSLEARYGNDVQEECMRLMAAHELLARTERALFAEPEKEWPAIASAHRKKAPRRLEVPARAA